MTLLKRLENWLVETGLDFTIQENTNQQSFRLIITNHVLRRHRHPYQIAYNIDTTLSQSDLDKIYKTIEDNANDKNKEMHIQLS